ncbi:MAG: histidine triad family protein [Patescibacteria group bacterium]|jgi:histidine triad (HIT) family protein|nr:histidine triad family protein [Patescibacteria group bacterium]
MKTIFEKIIDREIPAVFVYEDEKAFAIMDKFPAISGQVLIIPKKAVDYVFDLDEENYEYIWSVAKRIGPAMHKALDAKRVCMLVEGFHVPHVHIKMYPVHENEKLEIHMGPEVSDEILAEQAEKIKKELL